MKQRGPNYQLLILFSLLMVVVPLVIYPMRFGLPLFFLSLPLVMGIEAAYNLLIWRLAFREPDGWPLLKKIMLSLTYRSICAALLAGTFIVAYETEPMNAILLASWNYLPALLLQGLAAPWVIGFIQPTAPTKKRTDSQRVIFDGQPHPPQPEPTFDRQGPLVTFRHADEPDDNSRERSARPMPTPPIAAQERPREQTRMTPMPATNWQGSALTARPYGELTGFDRATRYIGEHGAVQLAAVVDAEGLLLAQFTRGSVDAELWAPMATQLFALTGEMLHRRGVASLDKVDLTMDDKRIIAAREGERVVLVVADRQGDETLPVRVHQSLETIARYVQERYPVPTGQHAEKAYV